MPRKKIAAQQPSSPSLSETIVDVTSTLSSLGLSVRSASIELYTGLESGNKVTITAGPAGTVYSEPSQDEPVDDPIEDGEYHCASVTIK